MSSLFYQPFDLCHRRRFAPLAPPPPFNAARRMVGNPLFEETPWVPARPSFPPATSAPGGDVGRSAAVSLSFTGKPSDDPYANLGLSVGVGQGLGADQSQVLAVEILASFAGRSAARIV